VKECGCARFERLDTEAVTGGARTQIERFARGRQERWGCAAAGCAPRPLSPDRKALDVTFARAMRAQPCGGCPFESLYAGDEHAQELFDASLLVREQHTTWPDALGREITAADRDGLLVLERSRGVMNAIEAREIAAERERRQRRESEDE
jgi:hypothetical protein